MVLIWSKKSKAEKNSNEETRKATVVAGEPIKAKSAKESKPVVVPAKTKTVAAPVGHFDDTAGAIIRPHITEKSGLLSQSGVYTFQITQNTTKAGVAKAMKTLYKVTPVKIGIINLPNRKVFVKGRFGSVSGIRKAMVTLKKGEKIDFV